MASPYDKLLNPTFEDLYDDLQLDYFYTRIKHMFPSVLSQRQQFSVFIKLMAWATANSYKQLRILKYLYNPWLVVDFLLPKLADTLDFQYPLNYDIRQLRLLIMYLQRIRRSRGSFDSIRQLIRLLEISEDEVLEMAIADYASVEIEADGIIYGAGKPESKDSPQPGGFSLTTWHQPVKYDLRENTDDTELNWRRPGFLYIRYSRITDWDFCYNMLRLVVPAGYDFYLETPVMSADNGQGIRNRREYCRTEEEIAFVQKDFFPKEYSTAKERIIIRDKDGNIISRFTVEENQKIQMEQDYLDSLDNNEYVWVPENSETGLVPEDSDTSDQTENES